MANPTTYFGWVMPTATNLVTNLPADFNTFGQAVDTSMSGLLGGTTGQVLSKTSNTNMAFTWVSDATGMANPMTTTGDTIYSSPGSTPVRRAIGTAGQVLTVAGGIPTWATPAASGSMTLLSTTTLTAASTVTVSSISGAYKNLYIEVENPYGATADRDLRMRLNSDSTTNYGGILNYANSVNVTPAVGASASSSTRIDDPSNANMTTTDTKNFTTMTIYNYASATSTHLFQRISRTRNASGETSVGIYNGVWGLGAAITAAITSIDFIYGIGTGGNWGGGTVRIYGVN